MHREPDPDGPEIPDDHLTPPDAFDAIVAGWRATGDVPRWPDEPDDGPQPDEVDLEVERLAAPLFDPAAGAPVPELDEHFVPPEPPPLPRIGPPAMVGLTLIVLGIVLIASPGWVGVPTPYGVPLGLVSIASGLGWLVLRLWPDHADGSYDDGLDDDDDGAVL